jgi:hypothetical protein
MSPIRPQIAHTFTRDPMHLVRCSIPQEPLEDAPRSVLLADSTEGEQWDGFWSADAYFVRCTTTAGAIEWFQIADDEAPIASPEPRVLALRPHMRTHSRVSVVVAQSPDGRRMLVGGSVRRSSR